MQWYKSGTIGIRPTPSWCGKDHHQVFSPQSSLQSVSSEVSTEMLRPEIRTKTGEKEARNRVNPVDLPSLSLRKPYYIVLSYSNGFKTGKLKIAGYLPAPRKRKESFWAMVDDSYQQKSQAPKFAKIIDILQRESHWYLWPSEVGPLWAIPKANQRQSNHR